jgi:hypothetical protein
VLLQSGQLLSSRNESYVRSGVGQAPAEVAADASGSYDCYFQYLSFLQTIVAQRAS